MVNGIRRKPASSHSERSYDPIKHYTQENSRVDPAHGMPHHHPYSIHMCERLGKNSTQNDHRSPYHQCPKSWIFTSEEVWPDTNKGEDSSNNDAELSNFSE